jgi:carbon storage regulator CsrA
MALVLSRKSGQSVSIGQATVTVKVLKGGGLKWVIDAPREVLVLRTEVLERRKAG